MSETNNAISSAGNTQQVWWRFYVACGLIFVAALGICIKAQGYFGSHIRGNDGQLYYMQVRSIVMDGDLDIRNDRELTPKKQVFQDSDGNFTHPPTLANGRLANKYTFGWALISLPAYLPTYLVFGGDGFGMPYSLSMGIWHCLIALSGLFALGHTVGRRNSPDAGAVAMLGLFFATNMIYYTSIYPVMNHAASLGVICWLLFLALKVHTDPKRFWCWMATLPLLFLLVLLRPTDLVIGMIFLPALWRMIKQRKYTELSMQVVIMALAVIAAVLCQFIIWRWSYGFWIFNTYTSPTDGFDWFSPHLLSITFSELQGGWRFHPYLMLGLIAMGAAAWLSRKSSMRGILLGVFLGALLHLYVYACFRTWWGGHGFGNRFLLNAAPLALPAVAYLFHRYGKTMKISHLAILGVLASMNLLFLLASISGKLPQGKAISIGEFFGGLI